MHLGGASIAISQKLKFKGEDRASYRKLRNGGIYVGIYDGHNGSHAADWCAAHMPDIIENYYENGASTILAIKNAFLHAHDAITDDSGTTASLLIAYGAYIIIAHVGDSRAVLCHKGTAVTITEDHHCDWEAERIRIQAMEQLMSRTLILGNRIDGLMLTRSIGDHRLSEAIIPHPVVHEFLWTQDDEFLILATDGLWDVCTGTKAIQVAMQHKLYSTTDMADALVNYAIQQYHLRKLRADDITCCVINLKLQTVAASQHIPRENFLTRRSTRTVDDPSQWSFESLMEQEYD